MIILVSIYLIIVYLSIYLQQLKQHDGISLNLYFNFAQWFFFNE